MKLIFHTKERATPLPELLGFGIYKDVAKDAKRLVEWDKEYTPIKENTKTYKRNVN